MIFGFKSKISSLVYELQLVKVSNVLPFRATFAKLSFINQQWDLTFDSKNQFLDPKLVGFGSLNVKIGLKLWKLWQY